MGRAGAEGFAEAVNEGSVSLTTAVTWHLQHNHFPPVPTLLVAPAIAAIEAANEGAWDLLIDLPFGVQYKDGSRQVEAGVLIESLHLDSFITDGYLDGR